MRKKDHPQRMAIPDDVLRAAERAGLSHPTWYCGQLVDRSAPRKKTFEVLMAEAKRRPLDGDA